MRIIGNPPFVMSISNFCGNLSCNLLECACSRPNTSCIAHHTDPPSLNPKQLAFAEWARDPTPPPVCKWTHEALQTPPDSTPADLVLGALKLKQRRVFCACLQVFFKHCFSGSFSLRFRPTAGDTIICPCADTLDVPTIRGTVALRAPSTSAVGPNLSTPSHLDVPTSRGTVTVRVPSTSVAGPSSDIRTPSGSRSASPTPADGGEGWRADPSPGFRRLMEEFLHLDPVQPQHLGREASVRPGPTRKIHSPEHVLMECPLTEPHRHLIRDSILGTVNVRNLFYTIKGAESLATFLLRSNSLLRPLPPRPDPP